MRSAILIALFSLLPVVVSAQETAPSVGDGPFDRLILRGGTMIDGAGAPPIGPVDIVVEGNRIVEIRNVGFPGLPIEPGNRPAAGDREIDATGMYILPGFIDMHAHTHKPGGGQDVPVDYVRKLWLAHGITTAREPSGGDPDWLLNQRSQSAANEITAPRFFTYPVFGSGFGRSIDTAEDAREWVRMIAEKGADGIKFFGAPPDIMRAALSEMTKQGLRGTEHHAQLDVTRMNVLQTASAGLTSMEHWYGLPEALFEDRIIQHYRLDYNYLNEAHRFAEAGKLWKQAAAPFTPHWNAVMDSLLAMDFTIDPTMVSYLASRDLEAQARRPWHAEYTMPSLWRYYRPARKAHGSYWFNWTTENEMDWKENYRLWMTFLNEYKNRGGRITLGSDSGYIYNLYGFGYIQEMELLREAGFHPLEVIRSATLLGAEALGAEDEIGSIQVGKRADFVLVDENPLENLSVLYGTGSIKLNDETGEVERVGGVVWTIKDGVVFDARQLLEDVRMMVDEAKRAEGIPTGGMPMPIETVRR